jgi:hypothetical protein
MSDDESQVEVKMKLRVIVLPVAFSRLPDGTLRIKM